jgi:hypothetical protein
MLTPARKFATVLRASFMALLLLGLATQPVLIAVGQLHEVEHALFDIGDHGHELEDGHQDGADSQHDPGHATGSHSLMHHHAVVVAADVLTIVGICPCVTLSTTFILPERAVTAGRCAVHFRPPIA